MIIQLMMRCIIRVVPDDVIETNTHNDHHQDDYGKSAWNNDNDSCNDTIRKGHYGMSKKCWTSHGLIGKDPSLEGMFWMIKSGWVEEGEGTERGWKRRRKKRMWSDVKQELRDVFYFIFFFSFLFLLVPFISFPIELWSRTTLRILNKNLPKNQ